MSVVENYGDSQLWENTLLTKNLPADVAIRIFIFVDGVTFQDMTTERWVTASDLDGAGAYRFRMIHPNSVEVSTCHTIIMYQGGVNLGEAYYSGVLMPED